MPQSTLDTIADDGVTHLLGHHETDLRLPRVRLKRQSSAGVYHHRWTSGTDTVPHSRVELFRRTHPERSGQHCQAESSERPLRRRAEMMARPARVLMRARKPCVRERRRLLGWNVRLLKGSLRRSCCACFGRSRSWSSPTSAACWSAEMSVLATAHQYYATRLFFGKACTAQNCR